MSPRTLPPRPPGPTRRLTMAPSPGPSTGAVPASKRRLDFPQAAAAATPPRSAKRRRPANLFAAEDLVQLVGSIRRDLARVHAGTPSASTRSLLPRSPATPMSRSGSHLLLRSPATPKSTNTRLLLHSPATPRSAARRLRVPTAAARQERPVEAVARIRTLADGGAESALEVVGSGTSVRVRHTGACREFALDGVSASADEGLEAFYARFVRPRVEGVRAGAKCTVMVYGPTGSGKSHTMFGSDEQPGVVYRALTDVLEGGGDGDGESLVRVSVLEIYNEQVYDLLAGSGGANPKVRLELMGTRAKNATYISGNEAGKLSREVAEVEKRRAVKGTSCNARSSRSHCMIVLDVPSVGGRLMLVDMAGSENIEAAGQTGHEAKSETGRINQGNTTLKRVVESIANGDSHVPFRDSKLTMLLRDSFDDEGSKILMILCASPDPKDLHKTISTLEYGARAKCTRAAAHASTPSGKISSKDARYEMRLKDEEIARLRMKVRLMEAAAKEEEIRVKAVDEETRVLRSEMRMMEENMLMQHQELLAVKQWLQQVEREKLDVEDESHLAWRVMMKLAVYLQNLGSPLE
ncbi:kinesin-like protein KIN-10A [Triticum urartu]|uniref:kinesin-like protein KIN-10A n=1 Tax=Triticum urartu TaxID=4572 RepID=UPI002044C4B3|nr:kinesin-like protein KIN-10A [Triticum urartu]XP_048534007.1 kinesin-like protein KIN-10A [Triticum urartu]